MKEDYRFVYDIKCCEHKVNFDTSTIVDNILTTRAKIVNEEVIKQLRKIGEEKGINELIVIDESKVLKIAKLVKALEIITKYIKIDATDYVNDFGFFPYIFRDTQYVSLRSSKVMTKEEYDLLKEVLDDGK